MILKSVQTILHPPELKGRDRRRYWIAVGGWFAVVFGGMAVLGSLYVFLVWILVLIVGDAALRPYQYVLLIGVITIGIISIVGGDRLWSHLFIRSGYLSDAATIRILSNRAPTQKSERRHRWLGHALMLVIYGGMGIWAVLGQQWWMLVIVVPLGVWGIFLIRNAWKEADRMLEGGPIPPASEERIGYINKVLDERHRNGRDTEDPGT